MSKFIFKGNNQILKMSFSFSGQVNVYTIVELNGSSCGCFRCCFSSHHNKSLCILEGTSNSTDIWNAVNGLNQQGYEGALGVATTHQTQAGNYSSLQPAQSHQVRFTSSTLDVDSAAYFVPCVFKIVVPSCSGLHLTYNDGCWYEQGSSTHVHFSPRQHSTTRPINQLLREFNRWGNVKK